MSYDQALESLRAERDKLDQVITLLEGINGNSPSPARRAKGGEQRRPPVRGKAKYGKGRGPDAAVLAQAKALRAEGVKAAEIAKEVGVKVGTINGWASKYGWPKPKAAAS